MAGRPVSGLESEEQSVAEYYEHEIYIDLPGNSCQYRSSTCQQQDQLVIGCDGMRSQREYEPVHNHDEVAEIQVTMFMYIAKVQLNYLIEWSRPLSRSRLRA